MDNTGTDVKHVQNTSTFAMVLCLLSLVSKTVSAILGKTTLQYIDATRCLIETTVVVIWWYICYKKSMNISPETRNRFNSVVRISMCCSAVLMAVFAIVRFIGKSGESGILYLGMTVSIIGTVTNFIVSRRYSQKAGTDKSIRRQCTLFRIKSLADASVALTLALMMLLPGSPFVVYCQFFTSLAVSAAMALGGILR